MPTALIESTRADRPCSPNWLRGWYGFGRMRASGTSRSMDPADVTGSRRDERAEPLAQAATPDHR